jgi:hypothetical protein
MEVFWICITIVTLSPHLAGIIKAIRDKKDE